MISEKRGFPSRELAETLAVEAFAWLASDADLLGNFMAATGTRLGEIRDAAGDPGFLTAVLDFITSDDVTILAFAAHAGMKPERVANARRILNGHD